MQHRCDANGLKGTESLTIHTPLQTLQNLHQLYQCGFCDSVTDAALDRIVGSQAARDETVLYDLEHDLSELEQKHGMTSEEFFHRWQAGKMSDTEDFMDWNALYQIAREICHRLRLLRNESESVSPRMNNSHRLPNP